MNHSLRYVILALAFTSSITQASFANPSPCSLLFRPPFAEWEDSELVVQSETNLEHLESIPYEYTDLLVNNRIVIRGLPKAGSEARYAPRRLSADEVKKLVFRHYTTPEGLDKIMSRKRLVAGPVSYVASPYVYIDITGIFLTTSEFKPEAVGLASNIHSRFVDFTLPEGTAVLYLEPGIYAVPGSSAVPEWLIRSVKNKVEGSTVKDKLSTIGYSPMEIPIKSVIREDR